MNVFKIYCRSYSSASVAQHSKYYDVIIAGGGMVGSIMACSCAASSTVRHKSVLLLEAGSGEASKILPANQYSNRVSAINPGSRRFFEKIGIWQDLTADKKFKPVKQLRVWDACSQSHIHFELENLQSDVAYIVENSKIIDSALKMLTNQKKNHVEIKNNAKIVDCKIPDDLSKLAEISLSDGSKFTTSLLIGADGSNSFVRKSMQSHYLSWNYDQKAIVATLQLNAVGDNSIAWQRFTPNGPVALLPLTESLSSLVWTTTCQEAERLGSLSNDQFVDNLNQVMWEDSHQSYIVNSTLSFVDNCIDRIFPVPNKIDHSPPTVVNVIDKSRASFPLGFGHSTRYVKTRTVLIGDAAHRVHPLAGQGVNLGFGDCATLIEILDRIIDQGADLGSLVYLNDYESKRQLHNLPVMLSIDFLNRLYNTDFTPLVFLRSLGLNATNHANFAKDFIMNRASQP